VALGRRAAEVAEPQPQTNGEFSGIAPGKPKGGRPRKAASEENVAEVLGVSQRALNYAQEHVAAMERYL
jgi:hypothetical protein